MTVQLEIVEVWTVNQADILCADPRWGVRCNGIVAFIEVPQEVVTERRGRRQSLQGKRTTARRSRGIDRRRR